MVECVSFNPHLGFINNVTASRTSHHHDSSSRTPAEWPDPSRLCGWPIHFDSERGKTFWEPLGPVAEAWSVLGPRINARAQALAEHSAAFSIHMVMVGTSVQDAVPNVVFCVSDGTLQQALHSDSLLNDIIGACHPQIETDFCHNLPRLLAQDAPLVDLPEYDYLASSATPYPVWATEAEPRIGARLYVACRDGGPPRRATAGPVFSDGHQLYLITVRHLFNRQESTSSEMSSFQLDLDMDDSDADDMGDSGQGSGYLVAGETGYHQELAITSLDTPSASSDNDSPSSLVEEYQQPAKEKDPEIPRGAVYIGNALSETVEGVQRAIDCALIEVQASNPDDLNLISYDPSDSSKKIRVTKSADMTKLLPETPVIIATSSGPVRGTVLTTLAYIKPQFQLQSIAVYPIVTNDDMELEFGDCGSLVVQIRGDEAHMLGHILFGHPDTAVAYILPIDTILTMMTEVLNQIPSLPPGPWAPSARTEFASRKFYNDLKQPLITKKQRRRDQLGKLVSRMKSTHTLKKNRRKERLKARKYSFEELFFQLPPEIRDQVIQCLNFQNSMSLRQVSSRFRAAVSVNSSAISRRFLVSNPLPPLARTLYPHPSPDLTHIRMVGHCHAVAWRLADHIVWWLIKYMYLLKKEQHEALKVRMKQRLLPPLFLLGRFFEMCRAFLKKESLEEMGARNQEVSITFPFEKQIMGGCSSELLLQTQDAALVLITFLRAAMRPASKYGFLERIIRYGRVEPPSEREVAVALYYGGLEKITDVLDFTSLDKKTTAIRTYCKSLQQPTVQATQEIQAADDGSGLHGAEGPSGCSSSGSSATKTRRQVHLPSIISRLPDLDQTWRPSAEALLKERNVIRRRRDIKSYEVVLKELIVEGETRADRLYRQGHDLWHALSDR
ncbi:hypothetical protein B0H67DRAFT_2977 [Lasiosphaeris hirsuta]|uniref:F-box domain-containing protein n=1 Tax=Lasiosphaeris hirsuta TaxID=260670 RepID=A0AA40B8K5_9PEZI|nr:hypothetical protein B0H67DRAFT_2977 [Lasiosphaeris hirsuta]